MCGIVAVSSGADVVPRLVEGLKALEYRGYDSAGISVTSDGGIQSRRAVGRLEKLEAELHSRPLAGNSGVGHTRWATHGKPELANTHPLSTRKVAVAHNGIIENHRDLRRDLEQRQVRFATKTDTECVLHLVDLALAEGMEPMEAVHDTVSHLRGAFALVFAFADHPGTLVATRRLSPLVLGQGAGECFVASDSMAIAGHTSDFMYLEEGDVAEVRADGLRIETADGLPAERPNIHIDSAPWRPELGGHRHYMAKEIHEQPTILTGLLASMLEPSHTSFRPLSLAAQADSDAVNLIACGTAHFATRVAASWFERFAGMRAMCEVGSEYRYRAGARKGELAVLVSQSGETADTLSALRSCTDAGAETVGVVNSADSTLAREAKFVLDIRAGREIAVASTKAFTAQQVALAGLACHLGKQRNILDPKEEAAFAANLSEVPRMVGEVLSRESEIGVAASMIENASLTLFIGRGMLYPIALEGALKLKEITYLHAEGYAAGELKHGPIALVDPRVVVVVLAPPGETFDKTVTSMQEVAARGGRTILVSDRKGIDEAGGECSASLKMPECPESVAPIIYAPAMQLLAYHTALLLGTDADKPRNLAKSVTVE